MNRAEKPINNKYKKKMNKEIKSGQRALPTNESALAKEVMSAKPREPKLLSPHEASKKRGKISKRTTPGKVDQRESAPEYVNREGRRWILTTEKQTLNQSKMLSKKLLKKGRI